MTPLQKFRNKQLRSLPGQTGIYALCDLDEVPIYVGQSTDGIRARARRHLTSARSDIVANRTIDVWEVAFVWSWPVQGAQQINQLERLFYHRFNDLSRLMNGSVPPRLPTLALAEPERQIVKILPDEEIAERKRPEHRLLRQIAHFNQLMDYILIVKDEPHVRQAMQAHFERLTKYYEEFGRNPTEAERSK
jgi:hypothetical protein